MEKKLISPQYQKYQKFEIIVFFVLASFFRHYFENIRSALTISHINFILIH